MTLATGMSSGTGATAAPDQAAGALDEAAAVRCSPTASSPGSVNNSGPDAPAVATLGARYVVSGTVRAAADCRPLAGVASQVWLADDSGGETDDRATVRTDDHGRYRIDVFVRRWSIPVDPVRSWTSRSSEPQHDAVTASTAR